MVKPAGVLKGSDIARAQRELPPHYFLLPQRFFEPALGAQQCNGVAIAAKGAGKLLTKQSKTDDAQAFVSRVSFSTASPDMSTWQDSCTGPHKNAAPCFVDRPKTRRHLQTILRLYPAIARRTLFGAYALQSSHSASQHIPRLAIHR